MIPRCSQPSSSQAMLVSLFLVAARRTWLSQRESPAPPLQAATRAFASYNTALIHSPVSNETL